MSTPEEADLKQYGAISPLAIGALLLGLFSFLALSSLLLLVVPAAAAIVALLVLRQIQASDGAIIGRTPAIVGLICALLFASIAVSSVVSRSRALEINATSFGDEWLDLVQNNELERAHQLHLPAADRQLPSSSLAEYYANNEDAKTALDQFFAAPLAAAIRSLPKGTRWQAEVVETTVFDDLEHVALRYQTGDQTAEGTPIDFVLVVERAPTAAGGIWRVMQITEPKETP